MGKCTVTKEADSCSGEILRTATTEFKGQDCHIVFLRTGNPGEPYLQFTLRDALIANLSIAPSSDRPTETITIDFIKVEIECKTTDEANTREDNMIVTYDSSTGIGS
jgi:type VI secretion system secreted protein Hcp